jgi:hypothetical protein
VISSGFFIRFDTMKKSKLLLAATLLLAVAGLEFSHGYSAPASALLSLDTGAGDAAFQSMLYVQNVVTGETASYPFPPHAPPLLVYIPQPGTYVFYARLIEAMDDYFYGATGRVANGPSPGLGLLAIDIETGKEYRVLINDRSVALPEKGKPVSVAWRR